MKKTGFLAVWVLGVLALSLPAGCGSSNEASRSRESVGEVHQALVEAGTTDAAVDSGTPSIPDSDSIFQCQGKSCCPSGSAVVELGSSTTHADSAENVCILGNNQNDVIQSSGNDVVIVSGDGDDITFTAGNAAKIL